MNKKALESLEQEINYLKELTEENIVSFDPYKQKLCLLDDDTILSATCVYNNEDLSIESRVVRQFNNYYEAKEILSNE